jgi:colicin import membrane protein
MAGHHTSTIASGITGAVLLIHALGVIALMLQKNPFEALHPASGLQVQVLEARPPLAALRSPDHEQAASAREVAFEAEPQAQDPVTEEAGAIISPSVSQAIAPPAAPLALTKTEPEMPAGLSEPRPLEQARSAQKKAPAESAKKSASVKSAKKPAQNTAASKKKAPASTASERLKGSSAAQAALQRLKKGAASGSSKPAALQLEGLVQPLESGRQSRGGAGDDRGLSQLMQALQSCVVLPEQGAVKMRLEINRQGKVTQVQVLQSGSSRNRAAIESALRSIRLPVEGLVNGSSLTVVVTFKHA